MNKFHIGDTVVAEKGLFKNVPTKISRIDYDGFQYTYYFDGFPQQLANTIEPNIKLSNSIMNCNCEIMFEIFPFNEFKNNQMFLALDHVESNGLYHERDFHRKEPHIHFYRMKDDDRKLLCKGSDIKFEYGGALSLIRPMYIHHDNHTEILVSEEIDMINEWMKENLDLLNEQLAIVFDNGFQFKEPIAYNYKMLRVYL